MFDGVAQILTKVHYIPFMKRNLISLGVLEQDGYDFFSKGGELLVSKNSQVMLKLET